METVVTGAAGFIGSHLCERLLSEGHRVIGIDCFTNYYERSRKQANLAGLLGRRGFQFYEKDIARDDLTQPLIGCEAIYHLAAMPGLVKSWTHFDDYTRCNVTATQRLLEHARKIKGLYRFIYASTSSVYGKCASGDEALPLRPSSPYGLTKLAGENLCRVYLEEYNIPTVILRYFSVYGPRQRPDMGYHKFIDCILTGKPIPLTGDGSQLRGNTYVGDCVEASLRALGTVPGETFNIGGGETRSISEVIRILEKLSGRVAEIKYLAERPGDQKHTAADIRKFQRFTGWEPKVGMEEGLRAQLVWQAQQLGMRKAA